MGTSSQRGIFKTAFILAASVFLFALTFNRPAVMIPLLFLGGAGWLLYRRPALRAKTKNVVRTLWPHIVRYKLLVGGAVGIVAVFIGARAYFSPVAPVITLAERFEFIGESVHVTGQVTTDCPCTLTAALNGQDLTLDATGAFSMDLPIPADQDMGKLIISTKAAPRLFGSAKERIAESIYARRPAPLEAVNAPQEWSNATVQIAFHGLPNGSIFPEGKPEASVTLDVDGNGSLSLPFDTLYTVEKNAYAVISTASGYGEGKVTVEVRNAKYDAPRTAKEDTAKKLKEMAAQAKEQMETFTGKGDVQIAVSSDIGEENCIDYSCVSDPKEWKFLVLGLGVRNVSDRHTVYVNPNHVTMQDTQGGTYTYDTATFRYEKPLDSVTLQPGANTSGILVFIVPRKEKVFTVLYSSSDGSAAKPILLQ